MAENEENNKTENKPEDNKKETTPPPQTESDEKELEFDLPELVTTPETASNRDEAIASRAVSSNDPTTSIRVGEHVKHVKYALPEIKMSGVKHRVTIGLDSIMTEDVKQEFNTYNYFGIFDSFDDMYVPSYDENGREIFEGGKVKNPSNSGMKKGSPIGREGGKVKTGSPAVRSLFNRAGQVLIGNINADKNENKKLYWNKVRNEASNWRVALNVPLMDSPATRKRIREHSGCSVKELVKASKSGDLGRAKYSYADFMYCKYLGRISNNYLITLRRFPIPPGDCITTSGTGKTRSSGRRGKEKSAGESQAVEDMGCLVTWLGTPGNDMNNILKYSVTMPFEEKEAGLEDLQVDGDSSQGFLPSIASAFNDSYRKQYCAGYGGEAFNSWMGGHFGLNKSGYDAKGFANFRDKNKIYGPVDVVKKIYKRSENGGLDFKQNITIVFDYELRSYNGINTRQAMLDLISNILNVTYTSGGWWGGAYRGGGMAQSSIFTNLNIFKFDGTFTGFCDSLQKDYQTLTANLASQVQSAGGILQYCLKLLNNIGGMLMGGLLNKMGRPARAMMHSLLSEQPVGFWHLMVGNPHHPIMSVGNMILKNTTVEHYGPLGLDDFPTGLKVTCELDRGKPRDNREVEKMYMNGNDRIYSSIGPKVTDMYQKAAEYKAELKKENEDYFYTDKSKPTINLQQNKNELEESRQAWADWNLETQKELIEQNKQKDSKTDEAYVLDSKIRQQHKNSTYIEHDIYDIAGIEGMTFEESAKQYAEYYYNKGRKDPLVSLYYKMENGVKKYYILTYVPKHGDQKKFDPNINMIITPYPNENSSISGDEVEKYFDGEKILDAAMSSFDSILENGAHEDLITVLNQAKVDIFNNKEQIYEYYTQGEEVKEDINEIDETIKNLAKRKEVIGDNIKKTKEEIKENDELIYISNRLQEMTANLDSWNGDELWDKFSGEEQIKILSKLADTDWYNLLYNWFGQADLYSISLAAQEIEYGSYKKKDTELKTYNPDKVDTAKASTTMLKDVFDRHDWKDEKTMDVSVKHVDGAGNIHNIYIQVKDDEKNEFLKDYQKYLESGDLSSISKYVDTEYEKGKSYSAIDGKQGALDVSKAVVIEPKKSSSSSPAPVEDGDPNNPGGNGDPANTTVYNQGSYKETSYNGPTPSGTQYNPNGFEPVSYKSKIGGTIITETRDGKTIKVNKNLRDAVLNREKVGRATSSGDFATDTSSKTKNGKTYQSIVKDGIKYMPLNPNVYLSLCTSGPATFYIEGTGGKGKNYSGGGKINPAGWWSGELGKQPYPLFNNPKFRMVAHTDSNTSKKQRALTKIAWPTDIMMSSPKTSGHAQMKTNNTTYPWTSDCRQSSEWVYGANNGRYGNKSAILWRSNDIYPL